MNNINKMDRCQNLLCGRCNMVSLGMFRLKGNRSHIEDREIVLHSEKCRNVCGWEVEVEVSKVHEVVNYETVVNPKLSRDVWNPIK